MVPTCVQLVGSVVDIVSGPYGRRPIANCKPMPLLQNQHVPLPSTNCSQPCSCQTDFCFVALPESPFQHLLESRVFLSRSSALHSTQSQTKAAKKPSKETHPKTSMHRIMTILKGTQNKQIYNLYICIESYYMYVMLCIYRGHQHSNIHYIEKNPETFVEPEDCFTASLIFERLNQQRPNL